MTYLFIEPPLRYGKYSKTKAIALFIAMLFVGFIGYRVLDTDGLKNRFPKEERSLEEIQIDSKTVKYKNLYSIYDEYIDNCKIEFKKWNVSDRGATCAMQKKTGNNNIALIGSSHAAHLFYGLTKLVSKDNISVSLLAMSSQSPFIRLRKKDGLEKTFYTRIEDAYNYVEENKNIDIVILADWAKNIYVDIENPLENDFQKIFSNAVIRSLERLKNRKVIIVLDNPELPMNPSKCGISRPYSITKFDSSCTFKEDDTLKDREIHDTIIKEVATDYPNVKVVDLGKLFCQNNKCSPVKNGELLYLDTGHLNYKGSKYVAPYIYKYIKEKMKN